jgi:hypothetical protein
VRAARAARQSGAARVARRLRDVDTATGVGTLFGVESGVPGETAC